VKIGFRRAVRDAVAAVVLGVVASEAMQWRATKSCKAEGADATEWGYVVLGYPAWRNGDVRPVQRWRVRIAQRSHGRTGGTVVFTGGSRHGAPSEAEFMASFGESIGIPSEAIVLEERARNTWENVALSLPLVEGVRCIAFCSDPMHAARARRYARRQRPDLRDRLVSADDYRPFERWWIKLPCTVYELSIDMRKSRRAPASEVQDGRP
jgi:hypothetical protein